MRHPTDADVNIRPQPLGHSRCFWIHQLGL